MGMFLRGIGPVLAFCIVLVAVGISGGAMAKSPTYKGGEDLYRRGYYAEAHDVWLSLARQGDRDSQYRMGTLFHDGVVVPQDFEEAARWYKQAAEAGNHDAQFDLATLYDMGAGVEQSYEKAAYWYNRAARQGAVAGQYNMAVMLEDGVGVSQDYPNSYFWYDQALRADFFDVRGNSRERVSANMTVAEILDVHQRAKVWQPIVE